MGLGNWIADQFEFAVLWYGPGLMNNPDPGPYEPKYTGPICDRLPPLTEQRQSLLDLDALEERRRIESE